MLIHDIKPMKIFIAVFLSVFVIIFALVTACGTQPSISMPPTSPPLSSTEVSPVISPATATTPVPVQYTLTTMLMPDGAGTITPGQKTFDANTSVELKVTSNPGYRFNHWSGDLEGDSISAMILMDKSKNITANFIKQYSVSVGMVPAEGGTVTPAPESYDAGSQITFTAKPKPGYVFDSWSGDVAGSSEQITVTVDKNQDINANFKPVPTETVTPPVIITMNLLEAQNKGLVEVSAKGQSLYVIYVTVTSKSEDYLHLSIPAGTVFDGPNTGVSSMVSISDVNFSLGPKRILPQQNVWAVDIDMSKSMPDSTTPLSISPKPLSGDLKLFVDCVVGPTVRIELKLVLFGLWTIQNNPPRNGFRQISAGSTTFLPSNEEWDQIKDVFQKAGIDTSKYQTFKSS